MAGLDIERLRRVRLMRPPWGQLVVANLGLVLDYRIPRRTEIVFEGAEHVPRDRTVFFAMNHTDRYNYWPFQYEMYRRRLGYTATWVKGKYYENRWLALFMEATNTIPIPSRGYVIAVRFREALGRRPTPEEYRAMRDLVDRKLGPGAALPAGVRAFVGDSELFLDRFEADFRAMIAEVVALNRRALFDLGLHVLVFPQGTRSKRLGVGRTGLAQMAQHLGVDIVPVGCNGTDRLYPGGSPFSKGGRVVYRIGEPVRLCAPELSECRVPADAVPMTFEAAQHHGDAYRRLTHLVMDRIDALLDPEYRRLGGGPAAGEGGAERFLL